MGFLSLLVVIELVIVKDGFLVGFRVRVLGRVQGVISDSEGLQRSIFVLNFCWRGFVIIVYPSGGYSFPGKYYSRINHLIRNI